MEQLVHYRVLALYKIFPTLCSGSIEAAGILKKADGFSEQRRRRMSLAAVAVEEEEDDDDAMEAVAAAEREKMMKRRVSFSNHHNVRVFQVNFEIFKNA